MSWTLGTVGVSRGDYSELGHAGMPQVGYGEPESREALAAAKRAIRAIIQSGALGDGPFTVTANGHSNPDSVPQGLWPRDFVEITISAQDGVAA